MSLDERRYRDAESRFWDFYGLSPSERFITLSPPGISIRVQEVGSGPPALFVHGAFSAGSGFAPLVAHLHGFRCLLVDRPGSGLSQPLDLDAASLPAFADGFVASVLGALSIERAHVVGSSLGGYLALRSGAAHPSAVDRMVLLGCPGLVPNTSVPISVRMLTVPAVRALMQRMTPTPAMAKSAFKQSGHAESVKAGRIPEPVYEWSVALQSFTNTMVNDGALVGRLGSVFGFKSSLILREEGLRTVTAPTLLLWGDADPYGSRAARSLASSLSDATLTVLPHAGHLPWLDDAGLVAQAIAEFAAGPAEGQPAQFR